MSLIAGRPEATLSDLSPLTDLGLSPELAKNIIFKIQDSATQSEGLKILVEAVLSQQLSTLQGRTKELEEQVEKMAIDQGIFFLLFKKYNFF